MKFDRKHYRMKRRSTGGQAILEYIIIIALVAVAALTVLGFFGGRIRELISGATGAIGGKTDEVQSGDSTKGVLMGLDASGETNESDISF
jgi:Flp pilus assembly pilin Flp